MTFFKFSYKGIYGKPFYVDGIEYIYTLPGWQRPLYKITNWFQYALWKMGIQWHNVLSDECTPDFGCCKHKVSPEDRLILESITAGCHCIIIEGKKND